MKTMQDFKNEESIKQYNILMNQIRTKVGSLGKLVKK